MHMHTKLTGDRATIAIRCRTSTYHKDSSGFESSLRAGGAMKLPLHYLQLSAADHGPLRDTIQRIHIVVVQP
jgi:hypothetical protein